MISWEELIKRLREAGLTDLEVQAVLERPGLVKKLLIEYAAISAAQKLYKYHQENGYVIERPPRSFLEIILNKIKGIRARREEEKEEVEEEEAKEGEAREKKEEVYVVRIRKELV